MKKGKWTIVVDDQLIIKQYDEGVKKGIGYIVEDEDFWTSNLSSNIRAIQYTGNVEDREQVEYNDGTLHTSFNGNIQIFANKWDEKHLENLQSIWDSNNFYNQETKIKETLQEKINRIGPKPTIYQSQNVI